MLSSWPADWRLVLITHAVTLGLAVAVGWFIHTQGIADMPLMDEWDLLHEYFIILDQNQWWLRHHNEHRYPLTKLLWIGTLKFSDWNFKAPMYFTLVLMTASAVLLLWSARGLRGRSHWVDGCIPLLCLHWGHGFTFTMGYQLGFALVLYSVAGWVWATRHASVKNSRAWHMLAMVYALLLIPNGGFGIVATPVVVAWLLWHARSDCRHRRWFFVSLRLMLGLACLAYTAWVIRTMPAVTTVKVNPLHAPLDFFSAAAGTWLSALGPWLIHEPIEVRFISTVLLLMVIAAAGVVAVQQRRKQLHWRATLTTVGASFVWITLVALVTAHARGVGLQDRFVVTSLAGLVPVFMLLLVVLPRYRLRWFNTTACVVLVLMTCGVYVGNIRAGLKHGYYNRIAAEPLRGDLLAGQGPVFLAGQYGGTCLILVGNRSEWAMQEFKKQRLPLFLRMADNPVYRTEPVAGVAFPLVIHHTEGTPRLAWPDAPRGAIGLRLKLNVIASSGWHHWRWTWHDVDRNTSLTLDCHPTIKLQPQDLVLPIAGPTTQMLLEPISTHTHIVIESAEWLLAP